MRRSVLILVAGLAALAIVPIAGAIPLGLGALTPVRVSPAAGGPHTSFRFSLRNPSQTGSMGQWRSLDTLTVTGPPRAHCVSQRAVALPAAKAGVRVGVMLAPARLGGSWCTGTYQGVVVETERTVCGPPFACPMLEIAPRTIARFKFRVATTS
jgi:hypothetical protein